MRRSKSGAAARVRVRGHKKRRETQLTERLGQRHLERRTAALVAWRLGPLSDTLLGLALLAHPSLALLESTLRRRLRVRTRATTPDCSLPRSPPGYSPQSRRPNPLAPVSPTSSPSTPSLQKRACEQMKRNAQPPPCQGTKARASSRRGRTFGHEQLQQVVVNVPRANVAPLERAVQIERLPLEQLGQVRADEELVP
jgi:hypothetical protein